MSGNNGLRIAGAVLLTLLLVGGAAALGYMAYSAGVAQGAAQAGAQIAPAAPSAALQGPSAGAPVPYYGYPAYWYRPFGFGFLGCLVPLFFLFLVFFAVRMVFGGFGWRHHGPWGGHHGPWGSEEMKNHWRERAEQWHREMHGGGEAKA
jgi:hypothetical protein